MIKDISIIKFLNLIVIITLLVGCYDANIADKAAIKIKSDFNKDGKVDSKYVCIDQFGENKSPEISWEITPANLEYESIVIIIDDITDNGNETFKFAHWSFFNLSKTNKGSPEGVDPNKYQENQGLNYLDGVGYEGPCAANGTGEHTYKISVFVLKNSFSTSELQDIVDYESPKPSKNGDLPGGWLSDDFASKYKDKIVVTGSITSKYSYTAP